MASPSSVVIETNEKREISDKFGHDVARGSYNYYTLLLAITLSFSSLCFFLKIAESTH